MACIFMYMHVYTQPWVLFRVKIKTKMIKNLQFGIFGTCQFIKFKVPAISLSRGCLNINGYMSHSQAVTTIFLYAVMEWNDYLLKIVLT
jgi:hypothetical protein